METDRQSLEAQGSVRRGSGRSTSIMSFKSPDSQPGPYGEPNNVIESFTIIASENRFSRTNAAQSVKKTPFSEKGNSHVRSVTGVAGVVLFILSALP